MATPDAQTHLYLGYKPDYMREIKKLVEEYAHVSDTMQAGPKMHIDDVRDIHYFLGLAAVDSKSKGRVAVLNLEGVNKPAQTALLLLTENPPPDVRIIMHCPNRQGLLTPLVSRCDVHNVPTPSYGALLVDMRRLGMSMEQATGMAMQVIRGLTPDEVPDENAVSAAEGLTDAARSGDIELGLRYARQFNAMSLAALRQRLATKFPDRVTYAYGYDEPQTIAIRVLHALMTARSI